MSRTVAILVIIALAVIGIYAVTMRGDAQAFNPASPWKEQVSYWNDRIERKGGADAYAEFAKVAESLTYDDRHAKSHAFGSALFSVEGSSGISVCDARFSFGCFHQFLGDAISALGLESIPNLNDACFDALSTSPLSCQHGIGHGALAAIGYDDESLQKALDICESLPGADPIGGCYGGVFMEYNVRTMLAEAATTREYKDNPYAPCDALAGVFVPACIYWQPQWWMQGPLQGHDMEESFKEMGSYCRSFVTLHKGLPLGKEPLGKELSRSCFEGLGNVVAQASNFSPEKARAFCDAAGSNSRERLFCRSIGANHFGIDANAEAAAEVCSGLTETEQEYCLAYASNKANVANVLPL